MFESIRRWLLDLLMVPAEPSVPSGDRALRVFRAAPNYFRYRFALWLFRQVGAVIGLVVGLAFIYTLRERIQDPLAVFAISAAEAFAWLVFLVQIPFSLATLRLDFEMRWYILAERSLRVREGILSVQEKTMTYANIQQITIRQNPLQRLLKISDVQVRTAGGGSGGGSGGKPDHVREGMHEAFFRGVEDALEVRDAIRERVRQHRDSGLGDPDEHGGAVALPASGPVAAQGVIEPARELLAEVRALRAQLTAPAG